MASELRRGVELAGFRIESLLARGAMGVVYRAIDLTLEREVALKFIAPELASQQRVSRALPSRSADRGIARTLSRSPRLSGRGG